MPGVGRGPPGPAEPDRGPPGRGGWPLPGVAGRGAVGRCADWPPTPNGLLATRGAPGRGMPGRGTGGRTVPSSVGAVGAWLAAAGLGVGVGAAG